MHIEKVTASAFGPLSDRTLDLAPGMTVVVGRNESGKSSWHAATYAALCGRRRGVGATTREARAFQRKHRPWQGDAWAVSAVVKLSDGRRIELTHDLAGRVDCRATDLAVGRDVSNEIHYQGAPDGAQWLGLNRDSFAATACVNQAELLRVLEHADGLQTELQQAAANAGSADPTAAQAIAAIEAFARENVGLDRAGARKPLRSARDRVATANQALAAARAGHTEYLRLIEDAEAKRVAASEAAQALAHAESRASQLDQLLGSAREAAQRRRDAQAARSALADEAAALDHLRGQVTRAHQLSDALGGQKPAGLADGVEQADAVAAAIARWQARPGSVELTGPTAAELQARLDALPSAPHGETTPLHSVEHAVTNLRTARELADQRAADSPDEPGPVAPDVQAAIQAGPGRVRDLAGQLDAAPDRAGAEEALAEATRGLDEVKALRASAADATRTSQDAVDRATHDRRDAQQTLDSLVDLPSDGSGAASGSRPVNVPLAALAAVLGVAGAALVTTQVVLGLMVIAVASALALMAVRERTPTTAGGQVGPSEAVAQARRSTAEAEERLSAARAEFERASSHLASADRAFAVADERASSAARTRHAAEATWTDLVGRCSALGLPAQAIALRTLASKAEASDAARVAWQRAQRLAAQDRDGIDSAAAELRRALASRDVGDPQGWEPLDDLVQRYRRECARRAEVARLAESRESVQRDLQARRTIEETARQAAEAREEALRSLDTAARTIGARDSADHASQDEADALLAALTAWQHQRSVDAGLAEQAQRDWAELQATLDGRAVVELDAHLAAAETSLAARERARDVADAALLTIEHQVLAAAEVQGITLPDPSDPAAVSAVRDAAATARQALKEQRVEVGQRSAEADHAEGVRQERGRRLASVAEAEENLEAAQAELARVEELAGTLETTRRLLTDAQENVHRDIAPVIAGSLGVWLAKVTVGRYSEAVVDPASLEVKVRPAGGTWIPATQLSVGTAEQIYLLLRIALAEHLGNPDESCPLLLDDVTVQADDIRTTEILETLLALSEQRQVVLFAQEQVILDWARERLDGQDDRHAVIELEPVPVG